jgi:hypothetical protein
MAKPPDHIRAIVFNGHRITADGRLSSTRFNSRFTLGGGSGYYFEKREVDCRDTGNVAAAESERATAGLKAS